jgi:hypothetical protein
LMFGARDRGPVDGAERNVIDLHVIPKMRMG